MPFKSPTYVSRGGTWWEWQCAGKVRQEGPAGVEPGLPEDTIRAAWPAALGLWRGSEGAALVAVS